MRHNRQTTLQDIVSVECWYEKFSSNQRSSELFLHVRFQEVVFGGDPNHQVRFKLRLKKADIVVVVEDPITVPRSKVRRDRIEFQAKNTEGRCH